MGGRCGGLRTDMTDKSENVDSRFFFEFWLAPAFVDVAATTATCAATFLARMNPRPEPSRAEDYNTVEESATTND